MSSISSRPRVRARRLTRSCRLALVDTLERRRLLCGDYPWQATPGGGITTDGQGNTVDLSLAPSGPTATGRGGSGDYVLGPNWGSNSVTFGFSNLLDGGLPLASGTTTADLRQLTYDALGMWTAVSGLTLFYQNDPGGAVNDNTYNGSGFPQIRIGYHDIPEPGGGLNVLAHNYYPGSNGRDGDMHFDNTDTWGNGSGGGINYLETATHELGHGIGIAHANGDASGSCPAPKPAIMDACIQNRFTTRDSAYLFSDDIQGIQAQYGSGLGYLVGQDGVARVYGTGVASNVDGNNVITISTGFVPIVGNVYTVASTYGSTIIPTNSINGLIVDGMGGNDILRVDSNFAGKPITLRGGNGDDYFDFGYNSRSLGGIPQGVTVEGGTGVDRIWTYDDNTSAAQTYTITSARFDRGGWGGFYYDTGLEGLYLKTGSGADIVNVLSTFSGQPVVLANTGGTETVNIGSGGSVQGIQADVQINNSPSYTTININNGADTGNRNWLVNDVNSTYGSIYGLAPAGIVWNNADIDAINLITGSGVDTGNIARLSETLNISNNASNPGGLFDQITLGNSSASGMRSITQGRQGGVTIDNNPSYTRIILDDTGDTFARTATLDVVTSYNQLTGLAPATIRFDDGDTLEITLVSGAGDDVINVPGFSANFFYAGLTLNSSGGNDTVNLGNATNGVQSLGAFVTVRNTPSYTNLNINDGADTVGRLATVDYNAGTDLESMTGLAPSPIRWDPGDIQFTAGVVVTSGSGSDTFSVLANERKLSFTSTGGPAENVIIGPNLDRINADIYTRNPPSFTTVTVDDTAFAGGRALELSTAIIGAESFAQVTGFGATIYAKVGDTRFPVNVYTGIGNDSVTVVTAPVVYNIKTGDGDDSINIGSAVGGSNSIDPIDSNVSIDGGTGADYVYVYDQDYATAGSLLTLNGSVLTSNHSAPVSAVNAELWDIFMSNSGQSLTVQSVLAATPVYVSGGSAHDDISVYTNASYVLMFPSTGLDDVSIDPLDNGTDGGNVYLYGAVTDLGVLSLGDGAKAFLYGAIEPSLRVKGLNAAGGQLDLADGTLVVDYSGATVSAAVRTALLLGRNGGTWNGQGIMSSYITPNYALGYAEATAIRGSFPATFGGFSDVDNTSILVRYTLLGDANMDEVVNFDDLLKVAQNYSPGTPGRAWWQGDFDYNGATNFDDLLTIAQHYGQSFVADWGRATDLVRGNRPRARSIAGESVLT